MRSPPAHDRLKHAKIARWPHLRNGRLIPMKVRPDVGAPFAAGKVRVALKIVVRLQSNN